MTADIFAAYRQRHLTAVKDTEGYCRPCHRIVAVDEDGIIMPHIVHSGTTCARTQCDGTGQKEEPTPEEAM